MHIEIAYEQQTGENENVPFVDRGLTGSPGLSTKISAAEDIHTTKISVRKTIDRYTSTHAQLELRAELLNDIALLRIVLHGVFDSLIRMDDRAVIPAAKVKSDRFER